LGGGWRLVLWLRHLLGVWVRRSFARSGRSLTDPLCFEHLFGKLLPWGPGTTRTWGWPIAAPLERCAELLDVDLAVVSRAAARVEPYVRVDGTKVWSLMQLERQLRPEAFGRVRGGYISRRRVSS
jgi:hypothetical protein